MREFGCAALFGFVQEYHGGPTALPASRAFLLPIALAWVKKIVMRFEFLANLVPLPLHGFGVIIVNA